MMRSALLWLLAIIALGVITVCTGAIALMVITLGEAGAK